MYIKSLMALYHTFNKKLTYMYKMYLKTESFDFILRKVMTENIIPLKTDLKNERKNTNNVLGVIW